MSKVKVRYFSYKSMQELQKEVNEFLERSDIQVEDEQFYPSLHVHPEYKVMYYAKVRYIEVNQPKE